MTDKLASPYTITRQNGQRDLEALKALLARDGVVDSDIDILQQIADLIEEQLPPAIEEPAEFGSLIRAEAPHHYRALWTPSPTSGDHYWMSEKGYVDVWSELTNVEVLRVGIGEPDYKSKESLSAYDQGYGNGQYAGFSQALEAAVVRLRTLRSEAITSERKNAYDVAIKTVEGVQP